MRAWPVSVPVDPSAEEAREWLLRELSQPEYADDRSLLQRVLDWISELIGELMMRGSGELPTWVLPVLLALLAALVGVVLYARLGREVGPGEGRAGGVLDEPHLDADAYRARARTAFEAGAVDDAAADWFRAIAASAAERAIIDDSPGRTAHEVSVALAGLLPDEAAALAGAADHFDAIRYGDVHVDAAVARSIADLDERLRTSRPFLSHAVVD
ncbi:DUF4129 domain-containing protein [Intrasporangium calvum]|uniref:DUF4129 domain-containing protein n=1 Tax=Intrasporangium calvum TaxID=53358 RepID=A0ABT5GM35_9MICO|nr:DUF4129 domain-containing protein [Intrasporangium calvum]MDC5698940.1 DUF4129 domain-containing protein [Intrasporangium calvum]